MSRLIVKNLPKNFNEKKLRDLFSQNGTITDVQLKYSDDGKFRQFAFIGYQKDEDASNAIKRFNNSFVQTNKISVEFCAVLGEKKKSKDRNKNKTLDDPESNSETNNDKKKINKDENIMEMLEKYKDDPQFEEFIKVQSSKGKKIEDLLAQIKLLKNEENTDLSISGKDNEEENPDEKLAQKNISDLDYMKLLMKKTEKTKKVKEKIDLFTIKLKGLPYVCKKKDIKLFLKPLKPQSIRVPQKVHGIAYAGFKDPKIFKKALLKDKSFIEGHQISVVEYKLKQEEIEGNNTKNSKWKSQEESLKNEEDIAESGRIFARNLAYTLKEDDLRLLFEKYGPLTEVNMPIDQSSRIPKGFATITFLIPEHAVKAYAELDGSVFHGRMLHLLPAKAKDNPQEENEENSSFKQKKMIKQKTQSGVSYNWNALFLGQDAVAQVIADTYNTTKEAVVGPDTKGSTAVRLALGETQIVQQTKKYLEERGVILDAFSTPNVKRSKNIILVKNLPSATNVGELQNIFQPFGLINQIILPPSGITAIIEFIEPSEARKAFNKLAYSKFKNMPLYLEWAPDNSLSDKKINLSVKQDTEMSEDTNPKNNEENNNVNNSEEIDDEEPEENTTLFVKNINFKTTDESLRKHFEGCGKIHYANVATKKSPTGLLSLGYGFVRFKTKYAADKALKSLQQTVLDGKSLELKRSQRTSVEEARVEKKSQKKTKQTGTKILVRNVPFQATKKEIQELFATFGEIKALRLPKKMSGDSHRGFAFVDFVVNNDAKKAFDALSQSTHLYGRRLVLEWASNEEQIDEIRKRTCACAILA